MKYVVFAALAVMTVVSAGCCRTKCAPVAPACGQFAPPPPPPYAGPTLEK